MAFNIPVLRGRGRKAIGFVALFAAIFSLTVVFSRPSDSQNPIECLGGSPASAATVSTLSLDDLALGTNLNGIADWSTELPFLDGFKSARGWIPQCQAGEAGCSGSWATNEADQLQLDEFGWVKSLPAPEDPPEYTRVSTLLFREINGHYPGGQYVVLYDGEGTIEYGLDAQKDPSSRPNRDVINVTPSGNGIALIITATDPNKTGNYIRNIHVVPISAEQSFQSEIFNPVFIDKIKNYKVLRFMDWMNTNDSQQREWGNRPQVADATYAMGKGVPVEVMIALANRIGANPWFNMPHMATDEYMTRFAEQVKTCLDPRLKAYVELSNEVWNWQFKQSHYALEQGKSRWGEDKGDAYMQWYGMRSAQMSKIWKQVFGDQRDRVVSVISSQTVWRGLENSSLDCSLWVAEGNPPCHQGMDVFAITGYFSGQLNQDKNGIVTSWLNESDGGVGKAFTQIKQGGLISGEEDDDSLLSNIDRFQYHQQVAKSRGLRLVAYEGGQHLVRPEDDRLTEFFINLNRSSQMREVYRQLLQAWKDAGGTLFVHFTDVGQPSKWGSWGALEYVDQEGSPKYDALMEFIAQNT